MGTNGEYGTGAPLREPLVPTGANQCYDPFFRSSNQRHQRIICLTARQQIAAIDEMVVGIEKQKADEIKHRDFCIADLAQNEKAYLWLLSASTDQIRLNPYFLADDAELIR